MRSVITRLGRLASGRRVRIVIGALALAGMAAAAAVSHGQASAGVLKVRLGGDQHQTRVVIELDKTTHGVLAPAHPSTAPGLTLALSHVEIAGQMQGQGAGLVKSWTMDESGGDAQLHISLMRPAAVVRRFLLPPGDGVTVYRYVLDLSADGGATPAPPLGPGVGATYAHNTAPSPSPTVEAAGLSPPKPRPARFGLPLAPPEPAKKIIVVDAGHGGRDPGAGGENSHEKDITLAAAFALRDRLEQSGRYKVVLTRDTDAYIPLETRVRIARRANADLFISLHADVGGDPTLRGATVYTLSEKGASRADRQVFEKANWINVDLPGSDESVNRILLDLTQRQTRNRSSIFAETLLDHIGDRVPLLRRSHRDAGFMVLLAPDVPAVLMEMGFITNPQDERELSDPVERRRLMGAVAEAIDSYFTREAKLAAR